LNGIVPPGSSASPMAWRQAFGDSTRATLTKRSGTSRRSARCSTGSVACALWLRSSRACSHEAMKAASSSGGTSNALMSLTT
jgi:hypothetical protein